jgi:hypothetical protein
MESIETVRKIISSNTVHLDEMSIDPEIMLTIDKDINYPIFITNDNIYTREELLSNFPFEDFAVTPETIFSQQEIGIFMTRGEHEYVARDVNSNEEFISIEDLVARAVRNNYVKKNELIEVVKTKIFLGKQKWENFNLVTQCYDIMPQITDVKLAAIKNT